MLSLQLLTPDQVEVAARLRREGAQAYRQLPGANQAVIEAWLQQTATDRWYSELLDRAVVLVVRDEQGVPLSHAALAVHAVSSHRRRERQLWPQDDRPSLELLSHFGPHTGRGAGRLLVCARSFLAEGCDVAGTHCEIFEGNQRNQRFFYSLGWKPGQLFPANIDPNGIRMWYPEPSALRSAAEALSEQPRKALEPAAEQLRHLLSAARAPDSDGRPRAPKPGRR